MSDYQFWISIIISLIAIGFTGYQQYISNKQFLFVQRISIYRMYKTLLKHQNNVKYHFKENPSELCVNDMLIGELTNDSKLSGSVNGWNDRKGPLMDSNNHKMFLSMLQELRNYGTESYFIFGKYGQELYDYYNQYADLCLKVYQYSILMEINKKYTSKPLSLDEIKEKQKSMHITIYESYEKLCKISDSIKISKLEKTISFIRRK